MMHQPYIGERFSGDSGSARYQGPSRQPANLPVRRCASLERPTLFTTSPRLMNERRPRHFQRRRKGKSGCRATAAIAIPIAWSPLAISTLIETELKPYDIAALIPIITGAGGVVTTWEGKPAQNGGRIVAAGDPRVHEAATEAVE